MNEEFLAKKISDAIQNVDSTKPESYDAPAEVLRIENQTAWVHIDGGVAETPVKLTINAKVGDTVQVRVTNGHAFIIGNVTAPPTDDSKAEEAINYAQIANNAANEAVSSAHRASEAAQDAQATADSVRGIAQQAQADAAAASTAAATAETNAQTAITNAGLAQTAANSAQTSANNALLGLSQVESVVDTLNWLTEHSQVTEDTTPIANKNYYIKNQDNTFTLVTDTTGKNPAQEGWYEMNDAISNYVASHLALTDDGLDVMMDGTKWKVRIKGDGVYILNPDNEEVNAMTSAGIILGILDSYRDSDFYITEEGAFLRGRNNYSPFDIFNAISLKTTGIQKIIENFDNTNTSDWVITLKYDIENSTNIHAEIPGFEFDFTAGQAETKTVENKFTLTYDGDKTFTYTIISGWGGVRPASQTITYYPSITETISNGGSLAIGVRPPYALWGDETLTVGEYLLAQYNKQVVFGQYNKNNSNNVFEIGNGTSDADADRSNCFEIDRQGNVTSAGNITDGSGNVLSNKPNASALGSTAFSNDYNDLDNLPPTQADYVVEQGTKGNWKYRKWKSGKIEAWCKGTFSYGATTQVGQLHRAAISSTFPTALGFSGNAIVVATMGAAQSVVTVNMSVTSSGSGLTGYVFRPTAQSGTSSVAISLYVWEN